jgi:hypothetical protein
MRRIGKNDSDLKLEIEIDPEVVSEDLFREIAADLLVPVSEVLDCETQCNLYLSKLIYMNHMRHRAFTAINSSKGDSQFLPEDLELLKQATLMTEQELKSKIRELVKKSLASAAQKGLYAA